MHSSVCQVKSHEDKIKHDIICYYKASMYMYSLKIVTDAKLTHLRVYPFINISFSPVDIF